MTITLLQKVVLEAVFSECDDDSGSFLDAFIQAVQTDIKLQGHGNITTKQITSYYYRRCQVSETQISDQHCTQACSIINRPTSILKLLW